MARKLLCMECAPSFGRESSERAGTIVHRAYGKIKLDHPTGPVLIRTPERIDFHDWSQPCKCDLCGRPLERGADAMTWSAWSDDGRIEQTAWVAEFLNVEKSEVTHY